ncbi:MAG: PA2169 family four-helix-bundle protein [Panacibacter sp.]
MNNANEKIIETLNHLAGLAEDGKNGYEKAAQNTDDVNLKDLFLRLSHERTTYLQELQGLLQNLGSTTWSYHGIPASIHRRWIDIKAAVLPASINAMIYSCATGDSVALKVYQYALNKEHITGNIRSTISGQHSGIRASLDMLRNYGSVAIV